jgi:Mce-associated membrane protein
MPVLTDTSVGDDQAQESEESAPPDDSDGSRRTGLRRLLAGVLAAVVVTCVVLLVWMAAGGRSSASGGLDLPREREQAMSLTDQFVKRLGTYSPDMLDDSGQMPAYREQVREVITPKFAADFDKEVATAEQLVAQGGITRSAEVFATAVSSVDLVRIEGEWLVDDFTPVSAPQESGDPATGTGTTEGSTP